MARKWREEFNQHKGIYFIYFIILFVCIGVASFKIYAADQSSIQTINSETINMRTGPGITYDITKQLHKDTTYQVMDEKDDWFYIRLNDNSMGWVPKWLVDPTTFAESDSFIATVLAESTPVYEDNTDTSNQLGEVKKDAKFQILHQIDGWIQIQTDNGTGWIAQNAIEITPGTIGNSTTITDDMQRIQDEMLANNQFTVIANTEGVNIRSAPETGSDIIAKTAANDVMTYLGQEGEYYYVQMADGTQGYIANWLAESNSTAMADLAKSKEATSQLSNKTIVLDPGHGGSDPGAMNDTINEKDVALKTALAIKQKLEESGAKVILTRDDDTFVELADRAIISNDANADAFISLHYDSYESISASGTSTYYYNENDMDLAESVQSQLLEQLPLSSNGIRFGDFQVLRENQSPSLLLELGYMSNPTDVQTFTKDDYYQTVADAVYDGLTVYFQ